MSGTVRDWTIGALAEEAGCAAHRIEYYVKSRKIQPARVAGAYRVFSDKAAQQIIAAIKAADAARKDGAA